MGFAKLDYGIIYSSLWNEPIETRLVWIAMLAMCDKDGFVECTPSGLFRICNMPSREAFDKAICTLESPDPESRTPDNEGRRIERVDGGWIILNYAAYRKKIYTQERKQIQRESSKKYRNKAKESLEETVDEVLTTVDALLTGVDEVLTPVDGRLTGVDAKLTTDDAYVYVYDSCINSSSLKKEESEEKTTPPPKQNDLLTHWTAFKTAYPQNGSCANPNAEFVFQRLIAQGKDPLFIIKAAQSYADYMKKKPGYPYCEFMKDAANWLHEGFWNKDWRAKAAAEQPKSIAASIDAVVLE